MSERGVFAVDRGIFDHPSFRPQPFTDREAFMWMVAEASYRPRRVRVGSASIDLSRGQLAHSLRFMAGKWRWSEPAVRRFLDRLKTDAVIDADTDAGATRITICNYDRYQFGANEVDAPSDAASDARATQERRKVEEGNNSVPKGTGAIAPAAPPLAGELPADWPTRLFRYGVPMVVALTGLPEGRVRALIGKWRKTAKDDCRQVLRVIEDARDHNPTDPVPWIEGALRNRGKPTHDMVAFAMMRH